ncbi:MAG: PilZ domain-containing protein [Caulobacteraceae bacterium]
MFSSGPGVQPDDRREYPRSPAHGRAKLILGQITGAGTRAPALDVEIVDRSMTGLRIRLEREGAVTGDVVLMSAATGQAYEARVVWKAYPHVGLQVRRGIDMRSANGPEAATLRKLWRESFGG